MPECVAEVVAFLSDGFSAKAVQDGRSFAAPGRALFDPAFELVDDVAHPASLGLAFDTDGVARQRVELSRGGRCEGLLHDRRTAAHDDRADGSNGHAHHGSDSAGPGPAALVVTPGRASAEQLVAGLDRGLVVTCFNYCRVLDPKTMEVTGLTRNGTFWVESGEIVRPVTNLRFTQSFLEALRPGAVLAVGADARLADCEWGTGLVHTPALRLASWRFTGGAAG
jgi:predicted Zn-dependent protease